MELYVLSTDGTQTLIDQWTSGTAPHEVTLNPGRFLLHEDLAPAGYAVSLDIPFTLREDLTFQLDGDTGALEGDTLIVTDTPLEVKFAKVDENGGPAAGRRADPDRPDHRQADRPLDHRHRAPCHYRLDGGRHRAGGRAYLCSA